MTSAAVIEPQTPRSWVECLKKALNHALYKNTGLYLSLRARKLLLFLFFFVLFQEIDSQQFEYTLRIYHVQEDTLTTYTVNVENAMGITTQTIELTQGIVVISNQFPWLLNVWYGTMDS